jgi:8-oxo-dGTP diphosphatase
MSQQSEERTFLDSYNIHDYAIPLVSVDTVIFTCIKERLHVLLVKRANHPSQGWMALPGGFIDTERDHTLEQAALRKLREKTGVATPYLEQMQSVGNTRRDPRGWSVTVVYFALISSAGVTLQRGPNVEETAWWPIEGDGVSVELAFDHTDILRASLARLRSKVEYTSLPIYLLPPIFTLSELQRTYEIVLGRPVDKSAFRKRIKDANFIEECSGQFRTGNNRPAQLYRLCASQAQSPVTFPRTLMHKEQA